MGECIVEGRGVAAQYGKSMIIRSLKTSEVLNKQLRGLASKVYQSRLRFEDLC